MSTINIIVINLLYLCWWYNVQHIYVILFYIIIIATNNDIRNFYL